MGVLPIAVYIQVRESMHIGAGNMAPIPAGAPWAHLLAIVKGNRFLRSCNCCCNGLKILWHVDPLLGGGP
jgi:hypothetical protein